MPKGAFESGGERSPLTLAIMLIALSMISVGNGFFKPNISTIVGTLYDQGDRRRDAGFTIFYMGINLGSIFGQLFCPLLADSVRLVGRLQPRRRRHADLLWPDPVRWRPAIRLRRAARRARPTRPRSSTSAR